ncbi:hypothetical protein OUZ56_012840 [Daphnia magna]|uniref:Uncharacterized protein n=1 Tax=Daphnia magna TaxID=35525 RepID=A0ABQ9Z479_9CRUS|nr:hypothetical protein OUZ56_012840 [Daphnia magna]
MVVRVSHLLYRPPSHRLLKRHLPFPKTYSYISRIRREQPPLAENFQDIFIPVPTSRILLHMNRTGFTETIYLMFQLPVNVYVVVNGVGVAFLNEMLEISVRSQMRGRLLKKNN